MDAIPFEEDRTPFHYQVVDVRDVVQGIMLALQGEEAKGEIFNIAGPAPFSYQQEAERVAEVLGKSYLKVRTTMFSYNISIAKARSLLGYNPKFDAYTIITEALEKQRPMGEK